MDSKRSLPTFALFITLNLLLLTLATTTSVTNSSSVPKSPVNHTPYYWRSSNWTNNAHSGSGHQSGSTSCPVDALKLGVCADLLGSLLKVKVGQVPVRPCCSLIEGLVDLEAAVCLCTAIKADILGINIDIPVSLSLLLNVCSKNVPSGFQCY